MTAERTEIVRQGASLFDRRLTAGRTGNISVRVGPRILITPTGTSLGNLVSDELAILDLNGQHLAGSRPSKEWPIHVETYRARPDSGAVVHLHSSHAAAVSCLAGLNVADCFPPLTAYHVMRVGRVPLVRYLPPGDPALGDEVGRAMSSAHSVLLANHGSVLAGRTLADAVDAAEELEETARILLLLGDRPVSLVDQSP
ncbi:class II aldolase/adducin family protein [Mycolicibacterium sediminis]|uniref:Class II aldolase n=1 Tax=Mycolicibacterium sediminis TaxID=1286180 RepID=A0A7I7QMJ1_9MYCO|nr:class II aldolase/adducin family protein [Mycolicibacterium sediminis]BBY27455.1 class II aldolase [Mycolicibacterium sediminis]